MKTKDIVKRPVITEKANQMMAWGVYTFLVDRRANKKEIAGCVETLFKVRVIGVRIINSGKGLKKALVQLQQGDKIDLFQTGE